MKTRGAMINEIGDNWQAEEIEADAPKAREVFVEWKAAGLCHLRGVIVHG